jgi:UDP-N-acetylmuramoyl-L-alanyl-D-glutamate--2,6-diaminopimelate ligase
LLGLAADASMVRFDGPWGSYEVRLPLVGLHNVMNVLQATAAANCIASLSRTLRDSLAQCPAPPGRLEPVRTPHNANGPAVLVDYAHTHDALENVLNALRPVTKGKLIVLFGCGGDRDRTKRPKMAAACCTLADTVVVTSDNPRTEDPAFIISQILSGVPESIRPPGAKVLPVDGVRVSVPADAKPALHIEPDRAKAIELAVRLAGKNDVVLLAGKGHEDYQIIGATKRHFDDREQAALALAKRG